MRLRVLRVQDRALFEKYAAHHGHQLAAYAFANVYIWKALYEVSWQIIENALCIFYKDRNGCFMPLPPLGKPPTSNMLAACFDIMDACNVNPAMSRIENIEEAEMHVYQKLAYACIYKSRDYLCSSKRIAELKGDAFKSQRAACNYFIKHHAFLYRPLTTRDIPACRALYAKWMQARSAHAARSTDVVYVGMLEDSFQALEVAFAHMQGLGFIGRVVETDGAISAFTLGSAVSKDVFCVAYETVDPDVKGAAQYIFREFSKELSGYRYINIMDDLGLPNLRAVKLAYHPAMEVSAFNVQRKESRE